VAVGKDPTPVAILPHPEGVVLLLRVSAGAAREGILGSRGDRLKVSVRAAPERGKANRAVLEVLARAFDVPRASLRVTSGDTSSDKSVLFSRLDAADLRARLGTVLGSGT
jgi:uncharacterized protein (TIGR00251 family)